MSQKPPFRPPVPVPAPAAHVRAANARTVQARMPERPAPAGQTPSAVFQQKAAVSPPQPPSVTRPVAPHVQSALARSVQAQLQKPQDTAGKLPVQARGPAAPPQNRTASVPPSPHARPQPRADLPKGPLPHPGIPGARQESLQRQVSPVQPGTRPIGNSSTIQRKINYSTASKSFGGGEITDRESLIAAIRKKFPLLKKDRIDELVDEIERSQETWTLYDVYRHCANESRNAPVPLTSGDLDSEIRLPSKPKHRLDFGFTTRTRLSGKIRHDKKQLPLPDYTQESSTWHAEDQLMKYLESLIENEGVDPERDTIIITINNSPCLKRCAGNLVAWKKKNWPGRIIIHFANPHGSEEEYIEARQALRNAGIELHSFEPLHYIGNNSLTVRQRKGFLDIKSRRKRYRKRWNEEHPSDLSSDTEEESTSKEENEKKVERKKPRKRKRSKGSLDLDSEKEKKKRRIIKTKKPYSQGNVSSLPGTLVNVSGSGMNCLIRALLRALGVANPESWVGTIRGHINSTAGTLPNRMLDLAGLAGAILVSYLVEQNVLPANRGIDVYVPDGEGGYRRITVLDGQNPVRLYLADDHFQAIV